MSDELCWLTATELTERYLRREVSPVEVVEAVLARIDRMQPKLNCFITVCHEEALAEARLAEAAIARGDAVGLLHGIPYTAKDLVNTKGVRTTFGSLLFEHNVPNQDAVAAARMRAAGAILVGKTTTPEFGHKSLTDSPLFGRTLNAWDPSRTSGGSSGGAAVAVASGLAPLAIATDGGGSTRIPAACNGVVGLKQSNGVIPHSQVREGFTAYTFVCPMARTVLDTALMLGVMTGPDPSDPWSIGLPAQDYLGAATPQGDLDGWRIRFSPTFGNTKISRDVQVAFGAALKRLEDLGAELTELNEPIPPIEPLWRVLNHANWRAQFGDMVAKDRERMSPSLVRQVEMASGWSASDYVKAMFSRTALFRTVQTWFEQCDFLVMPTLSRTAVPIGQDLFEPLEIDGESVGELRQNWFPYTMPFNMTGHPAISLNCGFGSDGLPIGLQVVGRFRDEASLLRLAALFEQATLRTGAHIGLPQSS
jgi:aspartyl-tRNA(Asn)/glutamyl-tRNA(Gln) amidotransferase subunit A